MEHALPPENGDFLVELELLFILFRFGPLRSKDNVSQRNVPRGLEREETAVGQAIEERVSFTFQTRSL